MRSLLSILVLSSCTWLSVANAGTEAFGGPGATPNWAIASKTHIGTSYNSGMKSPLWFTSSEGILTEVYYPTVDTAQIKDSQLMITDGQSFFTEEKALNHKTSVMGPAEAIITNSDQKGRFAISHNYFIDSNNAVLFDEVTIKANINGLKFYLLTNPHINNSGFGDNAFVDQDGFTVWENQTHLRIRTSVGFKNKSVGFVGSSDGYQDLNRDFHMNYFFSNATNGNTATTGELNIPQNAGEYKFYVAYIFTDSFDVKRLANNDFNQLKQNYFQGWNSYLQKLKVPNNLSYNERLLYLRSLFTLKCHEDKAHPGAIIASISIPWGNTQYDAPGKMVGGYHLVWPRDLYNIATSLLTSGDRETALNALRFMKTIQFKEGSGNWNLFPRVIAKKGAFPQNVWVSGKTYWEGFQADQTGYPILLFYNLYREANDAEKNNLLNEFRPMLVDALNFLATNGPWTQQERWEENFGISPSTFSAVTAALYAGSRIFNDGFGTYLKDTANTWMYRPYDNIESWTFTTNGFHGDGQYYLRVAGGDVFDGVWNPNFGAYTHIANSSIKVDQRRILDQGFLQLALLGLKPGNDPKIKKSKQVVDDNISVLTPNGRGYYRYSFDAYGEEGRGRLWPLLSGEHARYYIERYKSSDLSWNDALHFTNQILDSIYKFSNDGLMIPEQVYEYNGSGTGSATPLAWSHAEYIKVLWSRAYQKNVENVLN